MKSMIVTRRQDIPLFDEAFKLFWRKPVDEGMPFDLSLPDAGHRKRRSQFLPPSESSPGADTESIQDEIDPEMLALIPVYSEWEALRHRNFADMTGEEIAAVQRVITKLPKSLGFRRSRRYVRGKGRSIDARGVFRENIRYYGNPIILPTRKRKIKPRPVVLICDISGSMERYTRVLLHFMHTLTSSMFQVETFLYSTHLTRITHPIRQHSIDDALKYIGVDVKDWGGGTRTGEALKIFNQRWSRRVLGQGAIVMLITDGWDRGDARLLARQVKRLHMSCHRLIWLNPLLAMQEYQPLTQGAQALLPHVDDFLPVHNLASLEALVDKLNDLMWQREGKPDHFSYIQT